MSSGTNWTGGRGHVKKARRVNGLKVLERGRNTEQYFAKLRAVTCNHVVQDQPDKDVNSKSTPLVSFKHAQPDYQGPMSGVHAIAGTQDDRIHSSIPTLPRVLDKPNKPTKQSRLPELMETAVREIESLDAKRAHINSIDITSLAGLDIASRKRKYGTALNDQSRATSKPFYYPTEAKLHAPTASSSLEPPIELDKCAEHVEDMLSFGTPSDRQSISGTQASVTHPNRKIREYQPTDQSQVETQSSSKEINIPPTLYADALRVAAQTLKLQDGLLGVQTSTSLTPWYTQPSENDSEIRAFNLFTSTQITALDGISLDPEPRTTITLQEERDPKNRLSDLGKENRLDIGNRARDGLRQDRRRHDWHAENATISGFRVKPHGKPRMEIPTGTKSSLTPRKPTGAVRSSCNRESMAPHPLDRYVSPSHPNHSWWRSDQVTPSSDHSNVHGKPDDQGSIVTTTSAPRLDSFGSILDFASVESSPSSSQEVGVSLATGSSNNRGIGLKLFDDDPEIGVEADA